MPENTEIERRWVVKKVGEIEAGRKKAIYQGYFHPGTPAIRIRQSSNALSGDSYMVTFKSGAGMTRTEVEVPVNREQGELLMGMVQGRIGKMRHHIGQWELDQFYGALEGLYILEIELESEDEPLPPFPDCIEVMREVTGKKGWSNLDMAFMTDDKQRELVATAYARIE